MNHPEFLTFHFSLLEDCGATLRKYKKHKE